MNVLLFQSLTEVNPWQPTDGRCWTSAKLFLLPHDGHTWLTSGNAIYPDSAFRPVFHLDLQAQTFWGWPALPPHWLVAGRQSSETRARQF